MTLRKKPLVLLLTAFLYLFINKSAYSQEFNALITSGAVFSQLDGDHYGGYYKLGFNGGAYVNRFVSKKLAAQIGLRYIQKGSKEESYYKCSLQYVELPLTIRYFHYEKLDFEAGVGFGYLLKQYEELEGYEILDAPEFNKLDLSGILGLNYKINKKFTFSGQFNYSLLYVRPLNKYYPNMKKGQFNNVVTFNLAYQLTSWK